MLYLGKIAVYGFWSFLGGLGKKTNEKTKPKIFIKGFHLYLTFKERLQFNMNFEVFFAMYIVINKN